MSCLLTVAAGRSYKQEMNTAAADDCDVYYAIICTVVATFTVLINRIRTASCNG